MSKRFPLLILGIVMMPLVLLARRRSVGCEEPAAPTPFPVLWLIAGIALTATVVSLGLFVRQGYESTLPPLDQAPPRGSIYIYFDRPGVDATVTVTAVSGDAQSESDSYDIQITVDGIANESEPNFSVVLAGSALPQRSYPDGSDSPVAANDCPITISGGVGDFTCIATKGSPESLMAAPDAKEDLLVVSGSITRFGGAVDSGQAWVGVLAPSQNVSETGERRTFQLPTIGTTNFPEQLRTELTAIVDGVDGLYVPELTTVVEYDWLSPTDILEAPSVEPVRRQPLTWVETYQSATTVSGTIVDGRAERVTERSVFGWGVLAGIIGGLLASVFGVWYRFARGVYRWWRSQS